MAVKIICIIILAFIISFVIYGVYSVNNLQEDPEKSKKMQKLVSLQFDNCIEENQSAEICNASLEEFTELARLEFDKERQLISPVIKEWLRNLGLK